MLSWKFLGDIDDTQYQYTCTSLFKILLKSFKPLQSCGDFATFKSVEGCSRADELEIVNKRYSPTKVVRAC